MGDFALLGALAIFNVTDLGMEMLDLTFKIIGDLVLLA